MAEYGRKRKTIEMSPTFEISAIWQKKEDN